jgi:hypothetical protein
MSATIYQKSNTATGGPKNLVYKESSILSLPKITDNAILTSRGKLFSNGLARLDFFIRQADAVQPLFQFKFNKVDKRVRKFSRGKIGKYQCIVQYIPAYKRRSIFLRWLINEINFSPELEWSARIEAALESIFFDLQNNPIQKFSIRMNKIALLSKKFKLLRAGHFRVRYK